jgi:hypothetical protein
MMKYICVAMLAFALGCGGKKSSSQPGENEPAKLADKSKQPTDGPDQTMIEQIKLDQSKLRQIGIALFTQQDAFGAMFLHAHGINEKGKTKEYPKLSWRVGLLPYLDEQRLYQEFKLDEPWDSEHNKKLIDKMPAVYAPVNGVKTPKGHTFYQIFAGPNGHLGNSVKVPSSFPDGAATTILVVEAGEAVPWTKPDNLPYDAKKPLPKLGGVFDGNFNVLLGDGSAHYVPKTVPEKDIRAMITPNGLDLVTWEFGKHLTK